MTSTRFDIIVFDFDGTLVRSVGVKRQAFFDIFPNECAKAVETVLVADPDGSRRRVIPAILAQAAADGKNVSWIVAEDLVTAYGKKVAEGVSAAPEVPMALDTLRKLVLFVPVYLFSKTPHDELVDQIEKRNWTHLFAAVHGYPDRKSDVLATLLLRHGCPPERLLVVGDGVSDEEAAWHNGCGFMKATENWPERLIETMVADND